MAKAAARSVILALVLTSVGATTIPSLALDDSPTQGSGILASWMKTCAQPFSTCQPSDSLGDLASLRQIVGNARIVAFGEGTHGTREFIQLRHRMTQYLATEMGFSVLALETNLPEAGKLNDYVLGGPGDVRQLIADMNFWIWATDEMVELIEWMRRFNASGRGHMEFTGLDIQSPDSAAAVVRRFLNVHDPIWADSVKAIQELVPPDHGFVTSLGNLPVAEFAGRKARLSGFIRTKDLQGYAGLLMRAANDSSKAAAFDNMRNQNVCGTTDWNRYAIELAIPDDADTLKFGVILSGEGQAWFDSLAVEVDGRPWNSNDLDLRIEDSEGPRGMRLKTSHPRFSINMDETVVARGVRSLRLTAGPKYMGPDPGYVYSLATLPAGTFAGHHIRCSGRMRTENVSDFAGLYFSAMAGDSTVVFNNSYDQHISGTNDWKEYTIEASLPPDIDRIVVGAFMWGEGTAWFDDLSILLDSQAWHSPEIDLELEDPFGPIGFSQFAHPRFSIAMDESVASQGVRSLRLRGGPPMPPPVGVRRAAKLAHGLMEHLEASRHELEHASSSAETAWAIRNAHVLYQAQRNSLATKGTVRDSSMAANVAWIMDNTKPEPKVVIWGHNGHIQKQRYMMGGSLGLRYGRDYVAFGLITNEGTYRGLPNFGAEETSSLPLQMGPEGSIEAAAADTGVPGFLLDLRLSHQSPGIETILRSSLLMRAIGAVEPADQFVSVRLLDRYDALAWIERSEPTRIFGPPNGSQNRN